VSGDEPTTTTEGDQLHDEHAAHLRPPVTGVDPEMRCINTSTRQRWPVVGNSPEHQPPRGGSEKSWFSSAEEASEALRLEHEQRSRCAALEAEQQRAVEAQRGDEYRRAREAQLRRELPGHLR
jgi:hypothetical protein